MISEEEVKHIAKLARLELSDKEIEKMQKDLSGILDYFDLLKKAKGKETKIKKEVSNVLREDKFLDENNNLAGRLIEATPDQKEGYIKVKQVL